MPRVVFDLNDPPAWMGEELRSALPGVALGARRMRFSVPERRVLKKRPFIRPSVWAERHRVLTMGRYAGLPWRNERTPYLAGIMDAAAAPSVQEVVVCKAPQIGVSEAAHNFVGWAVDRAPGPVLYVYPDIKTGRENAQDRIEPMITSSPRLQSYLTGVDDDVTKYRIKLAHMPIYIGWAGSAASLGNKPIRHLILDELDKYVETANRREADPISLAEKRTITYQWMRKVWKISTPTIETGFIWTALNRAQVVFDYHPVCPYCGHAARMDFDRIKWPRVHAGELIDSSDAPDKAKHPDEQDIIADRLAWYECPGCRKSWDDYARDRAVAAGDWIERREGENARPLATVLAQDRPMSVGFHLPSWISPFRSLSEAAGAFVRYLRTKEIEALKNFQNQEAAAPWIPYAADRAEDAILALCDDRPRGLVPGPGLIAGLTAAVDTQDHGFYFEIRAWEYGQDPRSFGVIEGYLQSFGDLVKVIREDVYFDGEGNEYRVIGALIDSMGHRTVDVYTFCGRHPNFFIPIKGEARMNSTLKWSDALLTYPHQNRPVPGSPRLMRVNVNFYKDRLSGKLEINSADPGAWVLHADYSAEWARQMCVEVIDEKTGLWINPKNAPNHAWDVSVYQLAAYDALRWRLPVKPKGAEPEREEKTGRKSPRGGRKPRRW
ncbi:MAG: hypothetical protein DRP56_04575 [Planctomycetota bacterium]|nr:MAG: hypothetical protein DRP56_04575 [Planctomycetota bacterium]